jgi:hypothetical protein
VVIYRLESGQHEKEYALTTCHTNKFVANRCANRIKKEAFNRVVVKSAIGVRNIEAVMTGVKCSCEKTLGITCNGR